MDCEKDVIEEVIKSVEHEAEELEEKSKSRKTYKKDVSVEVDELKARLEAMDIIPLKIRKDLAKKLDSIKKHSKLSRKKAPAKSDGTGGAPTLSQFEKPRVVDDVMADFAGWERGSAHSRVEITSAIHSYAKTHELQKFKDKRLIAVDDKLKGILTGIQSDTVTYPHIQKYIASHFV